MSIIQLKDQVTSESKYVFSMDDDVKKDNGILDFIKPKHDKELKIDQQLYMIGYNAGLILATTKQGVKAQMTSGKVTQLPDGQRLLYSIPALQGSSGSPVINEWGEVVAVNFAKLGSTDNFNFGIPIEKVRKFINQ